MDSDQVTASGARIGLCGLLAGLAILATACGRTPQARERDHAAHSQASSGAPQPAPACAAAEAAIKYLSLQDSRRPMAWSNGPPSSLVRQTMSVDQATTYLEKGSDAITALAIQTKGKAGEKAGPPSRASVVALWAAHDTDPIVVCPGFQSVASRAGLLFPSEREARQLLRLGRDGLYQAEFVGLNTPVVNAAQSEALAIAGVGAGPLAGGQSILILRKDAQGKWFVAQDITTAVS